MGRLKGTFEFSNNYESHTRAPLDARLIVEFKSDLISDLTWKDLNDKEWLYTGIIVSVTSDTSTNNGLYFLQDVITYNSNDSWKKVNSEVDLDSWIASTDSSIIRIDASLNDTVDIYTILDASLANKVNITGDVMTGKLEFDSITGFKLGNTDILTIDNTPAILGDSSTSLATSAVIKNYVDNAAIGPVRGFEGSIVGDGIKSEFNIEHLLSTLNQTITIYSSDDLIAYPDISRGVNNNTISFGTVLTLGETYSIVIIGFSPGYSKGYESTIFGNDVSTLFNIEHNLSTVAQAITVYDASNSIIYPDMRRGSLTDYISFKIPPPTGTNYSIVILGF